MGSRSPQPPERAGRGRRGRDDHGRSSRPGDRRRGATSGSTPADAAAGAEPIADSVVDDFDVAPAEVTAATVEIEAEAAPVTRVRSARGARTGSRRPGVLQSALQRARGVNPRHAVIMAVVLAIVVLTLAMPMRTYFAQQSEFDQLRQSNAQLRSEVAEYQQKVNEQGDPAYTEAKARARLQYARPGETVLVLTFPGQAQRQAEEDRAAAKARNPWYGNLWDSVATPVTTK